MHINKGVQKVLLAIHSHIHTYIQTYASEAAAALYIINNNASHV